jgi:uncharacterized membrane protein
MSNLEPKLAQLNKLIQEIEIELGKSEYTAEELRLLKNMIVKGLPLVGIIYDPTQL